VHDATVTLRVFIFGLLLSTSVAGLSCWLQALYTVHFLGGVQMPFGAIFGLLFTFLVVNTALRLLHRLFGRRFLQPFSPAELLTIYSMLMMALLVSTLGNGNLFLTSGPALFYFSTRENRWADLLYSHIPSWFAPGWDGHTFRKEVIEPFYLGGLSPSEIPWHAWFAMLTGWGIFLLFMYGALFFVALLLRKQWIENEVLAFPLVRLPLQMVETTGNEERPSGSQFWTNRAMWAGCVVAFFFHFLRGMNNFFPDWPVLKSFQGNTVNIAFPEAPWDAIGPIRLEIYLGAIGLAYLLTNDAVFSCWFFYFFMRGQYVVAAQLGYPVVGLSTGVYDSDVNMRGFQNAGAWLMMASLLLWSARRHLVDMARSAWRGSDEGVNDVTGLRSSEPFTSRFTFSGLLLSVIGLLTWSWFAGINLLAAVLFFTFFVLGSIVIARIAVEIGFLYPEMPFYPVEVMSTGFVGTSALGAASLTKLAFLQPMLMSDMRTSTLPAFLHVMKLAHAQEMKPRALRRLLGASLVAIAAAAIVTVAMTLMTFYSSGALTSYKFYAVDGPQAPLRGTINLINQQPGVNLTNWPWMALGASMVWGMMLARSRWLWFPLHPLGYLVSSAYGIKRLWLSFFLGWLVKLAIVKFGGTDGYVKARPFMIGLILGNVTAMVGWMLIGFYLGSQVAYWPA
jgi:hypothetical protein